MVSAVFHSSDAYLRSRRRRRLSRRPQRRSRCRRRTLAQAEAPAKPPFDWRGLWLRVLPPVIGIALLVGIWALAHDEGRIVPDAGRHLR